MFKYPILVKAFQQENIQNFGQHLFLNLNKQTKFERYSPWQKNAKGW